VSPLKGVAALCVALFCAGGTAHAARGQWSIGGSLGAGIYSGGSLNDSLKAIGFKEVTQGREYGGSIRYGVSPRLSVDGEVLSLRGKGTTDSVSPEFVAETNGIAAPLSIYYQLAENGAYARTLEAARLQGDATEEFAERSRLFRARGLSSDTSLLPNYAIEESLKEIKTRGLLSSRIRRVAVIGPGLDFTDKQEGYDFYPQQTVQPFAVIDSLLRLGLATPNDLELTTFDLSTRVNGHLAQARARAQRGQSYVVQLPRDEAAQWEPGAISFWQRFGDQIGSAVPPVATPTAGTLKLRAVRIPPAVVRKISPVDTNIVLQRLDLPAAEKFDLIIATNILVYYDNFDQSLALLNVQRMLKPGGFLLSNNALLELPFFRIHSAGYSSVRYSARADDGDQIVWYRLAP
jgi:SAM-dependent methyltransferase